MGYTNKTSHYDLPQWIAGDKPSWLGDVNTAMLNIDTAIAGADASASAAESSAAAANAQVQAQEAKITKNTTDIKALTEQLADVSGVASAALPKNGGTMTGALTLAGAPTQDLQAATKKYVDENSGKGALMLSGGTMTGPLTLSGAPTTDLMAATKKYVDEHGATVTEFTLAYQQTGNRIKAIAMSGVLFMSGYLNATSEVADGTAIMTCVGNPFNLSTGASVTGVGSYVGSLASSPVAGSFKVEYDGTNTKIKNFASMSAGYNIVSACDKVGG